MKPLTFRSATDIGRSASPSSELGNASDDGKGAKAKAKSKSKRAEDAEFNLKRKRPGSPQVSPTKSKKLKASGILFGIFKHELSLTLELGTPISRIRAEAEFSGHPNAVNSIFPPSAPFTKLTTRQSKVPSKLRDTSIAPTAERSATPSSRSSSPDNALAQTPTSSAFSQSPKLTNRAVKSAASNKNRVSGTGPPKRFSPPKPAPIHDYSLDDGGDETGSSTDTDST
ncbi:hypothetical protein AX16_005558 [Volvariella volvacea WC 439]|nr:hypothetical protein AX16_005558 [Volvariella volvacea WC 439]